jgi:[phosphatase 2A protein]-leucine-carboxy methyltransferase
MITSKTTKHQYSKGQTSTAREGAAACSKHISSMTDTHVTENDQPIMATAQDALSAKEAAVHAGYYDDPFVQALNIDNTRNRGSGGTPSANRRRQVEPLIKRGTHARVCCMDRAIATFIDLHQERNSGTLQVVVLGAGKDTSFFRYITGRLSPNSSTKDTPTPLSPPQTNVRWYEVDHEAVLSEKVAAIANAPDIFDANVTQNEHGCWKLQSSTHDDSNNNDATSTDGASSCCYMISHDLRQDPQTLLDKLTNRNNEMDPHTPTLFVMECVQMYLPEESSRSLLQALVQCCPDSCLCSYEPILQSDPFGQVMEKNLSEAQVARPDSCLVRIRTLDQHLQRLTSSSSSGVHLSLFAQATGCDMWSAYNSVMTAEQRRRANQCEFLDEVEEWMLIMRHYCLVVASTQQCSIRTRYCEVGKDSPMGFSSSDCETMDVTTLLTTL